MLKLSIITPHYDPPVRGNAVTVRRIARQLTLLGADVRVFSLDSSSPAEIAAGLAEHRPDLIHAFHGARGGKVAREGARLVGVPFVVTLTGTDLYDSGIEELGEVFREAAAVVVFGPNMQKAVGDLSPEIVPKLAVIPQGVELPVTAAAPRSGAEEFIFLLPAGIRPVKNVLLPLHPLARLHRHDQRVRFILAGPVLDPVYAALVLAELEKHPFARYLGVVDHDAMGNLYLEADVVLNSSHSEGGMANSILEALALGRPVLAAAIDGNRFLVQDGVTGLFYRDEEEFLRQAGRLLRDPELGRRLGEEGRAFVTANFSASKEAAAYLELYRKSMKGCSRQKA